MITRLVFDLDYKDGSEVSLKTLEWLAQAVRNVAKAQGVGVRMVTTGTLHEVGIDTDPDAVEDDRGKNRIFSEIWKS